MPSIPHLKIGQKIANKKMVIIYLNAVNMLNTSSLINVNRVRIDMINMVCHKLYLTFGCTTVPLRTSF